MSIPCSVIKGSGLLYIQFACFCAGSTPTQYKHTTVLYHYQNYPKTFKKLFNIDITQSYIETNNLIALIYPIKLVNKRFGKTSRMFAGRW